jgi:hypothetical protein
LRHPLFDLGYIDAAGLKRRPMMEERSAPAI